MEAKVRTFTGYSTTIYNILYQENFKIHFFDFFVAQ